MISPRIAGTVVGVYAENDQFVKAGQVIVDLDPRDYQGSSPTSRWRVCAGGGAVARRESQRSDHGNHQSDHHLGRTGRRDRGGKGRGGGAAGVPGQARGFAECRSAEQQSDKETWCAISPWRTKPRFRGSSSTRLRATAESEAANVDAAKADVQVAVRDLDERRAQLSQAQTRLEGGHAKCAPANRRPGRPRWRRARRTSSRRRRRWIRPAESFLHQDRGAGVGSGSE